MNTIFNKIDKFLDKYLYHSGDTKEVLLLKKIWWLFHVGGLPFLLIMSAIIWDREGFIIVVINIVFLLMLLTSLLIFHYLKNHIEIFALVTQIGILLLSAIKVYLLGGLLTAGGAIFIGLIAPLYAYTLPNKKRAITIFLLYFFSMIVATLMQPDVALDYKVYYYLLGFFVGIFMTFSALFYYSSQVEKLKIEEKKRLSELDSFKTTFYNNITHEFRTPLTIILGMAEQIDRNPEKWSTKGVEMIKRNSLQILSLTNQMLDLSKLDAKLMPVDLIQDDIISYLTYLVESFHSLAEEKGIKIIFRHSEEVIKMDFDPTKILDIFSNLLSNAIKFTPKNGQVKVTVSIVITNLEPHLVLTVMDNGAGIHPDHISKVFDRYFQSNQHSDQLIEGTGIGLSLTRELINLLNGKITLESKLKKGSTFTVYLPITRRAPIQKVCFEPDKFLSKSNSIQKAESFNCSTGGPEKRLSLLIVENNPDVVHYLYSILSAEYEIEVAQNGQIGLDKALKLIPDLVISDVMMPVMDGFEFCNKLKKDLRTSHIPIIILSAKSDTISKLIGLETGADAYLSKPFIPKELNIRIKQLIDLRKSLQNRYKVITTSPYFAKTDVTSPLNIEDNFMKKVHQKFILHISDEEYGIAQLCQSLAMSRSQLYRKFAALTNTTVHNYIRRVRLSKAQELLKSTELNVSEIAYDTGFKNISHFSRVYSEEFGIAPSKERI
jgi:signal transduction histidine kinase/DNA-binding response OmpR family regulator